MALTNLEPFHEPRAQANSIWPRNDVCLIGMYQVMSGLPNPILKLLNQPAEEDERGFWAMRVWVSGQDYQKVVVVLLLLVVVLSCGQIIAKLPPMKDSTRCGWFKFAFTKELFTKIFPRASERRVLPIVGVCKTSSHLHIFSSSHPHIFTSSHLHIFLSSHLHIFTSSHLHIFTSSHLHIFSCSHLHIFSSCPLALFPSPSFLFLFWRRGAGAVPTRRHETQPFRTKEVRSPKTEVKLRFQVVPRNPFARNEVWSPKTEVKLRF